MYNTNLYLRKQRYFITDRLAFAPFKYFINKNSSISAIWNKRVSVTSLYILKKASITSDHLYVDMFAGRHRRNVNILFFHILTWRQIFIVQCAWINHMSSISELTSSAVWIPAVGAESDASERRLCLKLIAGREFFQVQFSRKLRQTVEKETENKKRARILWTPFHPY